MSASLGGSGGTITFGQHGVYANVGPPGSGLSYRTKLSGNSQTKGQYSPSETNLLKDTYDGKKEAEFEILDDGNVEIRDAHGNILPKKYIKIAREQNKAVVDKYMIYKCNELNSDVLNPCFSVFSFSMV